VTVTGFEQTPETELGQALFEELIWIHSMIRHDLKIVKQIAADAATNKSPEALRAEIRELKAKSILWQLKMNCLRYCRFVHSHHNLEDAVFFPALRQTNPAIDPIVDKLEADHRNVSGLLDNVEEAADALTKDDVEAVRKRVVESLDVLEEILLAHLDYEELNAAPTIRRLQNL